MASPGSGFSLIRYEGLRDVARALKEVDADLLKSLREELREVGYVIRDDAAARMLPISAKTASGFRIQTNLLSASSALVSVSQRNARTTGKRPDYGGLQMRHALIPAREAKNEEAVKILETGAYELLKRHGF